MRYNGYIISKTGEVDEFGFPVLVKSPDPDANPAAAPTPMSDAEFNAARLALEAATNSKNTLIRDDLGIPSVMVRIPAFKWSDVIEGAPDELCSAFKVGGKTLPCIYVGKYLSYIEHGRAYSAPLKAPAHTLKIDEARAACSAKGRGWHLFTNAEWCAIAHWARKNGTIPHGNTKYSADFFHPHEHAQAVTGDAELYERDVVDVPRPDAPERTLSGTSPASWSHDGTDAGIFDLTGNVWDFVAGFRIADGEIQVIPDNDSAMNLDESANSDKWRAINTLGEFVAPGSPNTYKYDGDFPGRDDDKNTGVGGVHLSTEVTNFNYTGNAKGSKHKAYAFGAFDTLPCAEGVEPHFLLKALGAFPVADTLGKEIAQGTENPQWYFMRNYGERMCARGSSWIGGNGFWYLYLRESREFIYPDIGFRVAYVEV